MSRETSGYFTEFDEFELEAPISLEEKEPLAPQFQELVKSVVTSEVSLNVKPNIKPNVRARRKRPVNYKIKGWYEKVDGVGFRNPGLPPSGTRPSPIDGEPIPYNFVVLPGNLTKADLEELHEYCVERINKYRSGEIKFSDGTDDPDVLAGLNPLVHLTGNNRCNSETAMGALVKNYELGGQCKAAHANAFLCPWKGATSQNSCCARGDGAWGRFDRAKHITKDGIKNELDGCLDTMWNEGIKDGQKGHWLTMKSSKYNYVSCGFAWSDEGRVMMRQDFAKNVGGEWYCRKPGTRNTNLKQSHCELDCTDNTFRVAKCCNEDTGTRCLKTNMVPEATCNAPKPVC